MCVIGAVNAWRELVRLGADQAVLDKRSRTAKEVAELHGWSVSATYVLESNEHDERMAGKSSRAVTAVLTHPMCVRHFTCPPSSTKSPSAPPENIRRLSVLLDQVRHTHTYTCVIDAALYCHDRTHKMFLTFNRIITLSNPYQTLNFNLYHYLFHTPF